MMTSDKNDKVLESLGKGSKKKLIIFAKFSAKGGGYPLFVKIINYFFTLKKSNPKMSRML